MTAGLDDLEHEHNILPLPRFDARAIQPVA
jgi:hypothetical protein